jgi:hypothetical protein
MPQKKTSSKKQATSDQDGVFFLKLMLFLIVGSLWIKTTYGGLRFPFPLGLCIGLVFALHEHFRIDRKIEFAVLVVAMLVGYIAPFGLYVRF